MEASHSPPWNTQGWRCLSLPVCCTRASHSGPSPARWSCLTETVRDPKCNIRIPHFNVCPTRLISGGMWSVYFTENVAPPLMGDSFGLWGSVNL